MKSLLHLLFCIQATGWLAGWLAVRSSVPGACTDKEELPVMLLKDKEVPQNH
ncbi:hypothetical protein K4718_000487 [Salmonella enterica]|nr:hypothetical protein [Salmonella enterica]EHY8654276.1 hypothetical protein [Salmonella enterica]